MATDQVKINLEKEILDYERKIEEKTIIRDYVLDEIFKLKQTNANDYIIKYLEDKFKSLRLEVLKLENKLTHIKIHLIKCY